MTQTTIEQAMGIAIRHHQAGRLTEAEALYRRVLAALPDQPDALHLLGALAFQTGHPAPAIDLIGRAVALCPDVAEYHGSLGEAYRRAGQSGAAIASFRRALELKPDLALALGNLASALQAEGRRDEALEAFHRALEIDPSDAVVQSNFGTALHEAGRYEDAIAAYRRALALRPDNLVTQRNLGAALHALGRFDEATAVYRRALAACGDDARTCSNLGMTLQETGRHTEALAALGHAIELDAGLAEAHNNLGHTLKELGRLDEAGATLARAVELEPSLLEAYNNLADTLWQQGRIDDAIAVLRRAPTGESDSARTASNLLFMLHSHPGYDAQALLAEHRTWARRYADPLAAEMRPHANDRAPGRRLRVGYVSPDFRGHAVGGLVVELFSHHDRGQVEVVAYSDVRVPDGHTRRLQALANVWRDTAGLSDAALAERIRTDEIDILVDLALHTAGNRMRVFARKPAPVQATMFGLPATTGLSTVDYRLTDPYLDPPGATDADYTERSVRLPHCFWVFQRPEESVAITELPALKNGFVTFGSLNQLGKISRPALDLWGQILQAVPGSRLVLQAPPGSHCDAIRAILRARGVAADRVEFVPRAARLDYHRMIGTLDVGLDPFPYNGHNSTLDALWMGVPVVTLAGRTAVGRGGLSILSNLGLTDLIAATPEQYVECAVGWASRTDRLAALRAELRQRLLSSPLADTGRFAADVEEAFRRMWQTWCCG
jgi:predicted O-linked N-acetylglucosamine transferase (SPINDLY family)